MSATLLEPVGGARGIARLVDLLLDRLLYDPLVALSLVELDLARLKKAQVQFFTDAFNGPPASGSPPHPIVRVSDRAFVQVVLHVRGALTSMGLAEETVEQLMLAVISHALARDERVRQAGAPYALGPASVGPRSAELI